MDCNYEDAIILPRGNNMDSVTFGKAIKNKRIADGLTQAYLAAVSGTGVRFIIELEQGKPTIQLDKALKVAAALNISIMDEEKHG